MAPRKKKVSSRVSNLPLVSAKSKQKRTTKKVTKSTTLAKIVPPKKKPPTKKNTVNKPKTRRKEAAMITESNEIFENFVGNIIESQMDNLTSITTENLEQSFVENDEHNSIECEKFMDSQAIQNIDSKTIEITEQLQNLEVQEEEPVIEEVVEFNCVEDEIAFDYISQEVTLGGESDNSNEGKLALIDQDTVSEENSVSSKDIILEVSNATINEIEQNLSVMMSDNIECEPKGNILQEDIKKENTEGNQFNENINSIILAVSAMNDDINKLDNMKLTEITVLSESNISNKSDDEEKKGKLDILPKHEVKSEKQMKVKSKKQNEVKSPKVQKKETKKKDKAKVTKSKSGSKAKNEEMDDNSIRRSSRIKSISVLKKPSVGHGLVKSKDSEVLDIKSEVDKVQPSQIIKTNNEVCEKPIKVKSRWRRSSELEMNVSNSCATLSTNLKTSENETSTSDKDIMAVKDELVETRLKQFIHLKENSYLTERFICKEAKKMICDCFLTEEEIARGEMACGEDCLNRLLMIECGNLCQVGDRCTNKKFQKGQFAPVEVFNTHKKGLGLRAAANIPYGEFILEYVGEVLNADEFDKRAEEYSQDKNQHYYFMSLRSDAIIDATQKGNISRFINHSCDPNAETQKWTVNGELRIGFFSTRTILAGEEVTFDYRFERYGKEAQKCFCEAPSCRGWLGEEPDEDEEGEDEEEEEENIQAAVDVVVPKVEVAKSAADGDVIKQENIEEVAPIPVTPKTKKPISRRKLRKELFEDDQLDEEIDVLTSTGLKNQAHTLKLSRLMLRAKETTQRAKLLKVLRRGELPCRRLFLDYHGLRLMHGYMTDAQHLCKSDKKYDSLRLEVLQTLAVLPIPNKTMLQDSKVLPTVEKWSLPLSSTSPLDSESNSPKNESEIEQYLISTPVQPDSKKSIVESSDFENKQSDDNIRKSVGMCEYEMRYSYFTNTSGEALAEEIANIFEEDVYVASPKPKPVQVEVKPQLPNYEEEIIALASKLLEAWANLKEVFRIPKKERIEQMKEHEREANKGYIAGLGLEQYAEKRNENRYRGMQRSRQQDKKNFKSEERLHQQVMLSKQNRRKLFALQVEQQEEERRRKQRELWRQHERNCMLIGTDPRFTAPFDPTRGFQCTWNPQTGQWQNYPLPPQNQSPMGYGPLPNTNVPPPNITPNPSYPYGVPQMQIPSVGLPPISTSRNLPHMVSPMSVGRTSLPCSVAPPLPHQIASSTSTITTNIHHAQTISVLPNLTPNLPPQTSVPQTPPPLPTGVPNLYQTTGYSPQLLVSQTQSPVVYQQQQEKKNEVISIIGDVRFMGPIPPPVKLPPKWKCGTDKYGRPYYYHIRIRKSQWEPPPYEAPPPEQEDDSESSSSESSSSSSDSSSEESDSDDDIINDSRLLRQVKRQMDKATVKSTSRKNLPLSIENTSSPVVHVKMEVGDSNNQPSVSSSGEAESSIDKRLKEQFNLVNDEVPPTTKRKRASLVQEIIISPRTEEDKLQFREDLKRYRENKEMLKKQREIILQQTKKHTKDRKLKQQQSKAKLREMKYSTSENAKKIKETFRSSMANTVVSALNVYRKSDCKEGRITNTDDFKHLARKLTHFVMLKEMKYISEIEELICSENVKAKARDYIRKYMSKFGEVYVKRDDEPEHYY